MQPSNSVKIMFFLGSRLEINSLIESGSVANLNLSLLSHDIEPFRLVAALSAPVMDLGIAITFSVATSPPALSVILEEWNSFALEAGSGNFYLKHEMSEAWKAFKARVSFEPHLKLKLITWDLNFPSKALVAFVLLSALWVCRKLSSLHKPGSEKFSNEQFFTWKPFSQWKFTLRCCGGGELVELSVCTHEAPRFSALTFHARKPRSLWRLMALNISQRHPCGISLLKTRAVGANSEII